MSDTAQTVSWERHSHIGPPWYSPPLSARSGPDPLGNYCHPNHIGRQTVVNPCGLRFAFPPTDWSGPCRLFRRGVAGLDGWRPRRQTRGLELAAEHETGKLLRDYADENSCPIFGPYSPTTNPYNPSVTPDALDIVITKNFSFPVYLNSRSALISDRLPVLIDTACRSSLHHPPDRPDFRRTDWANFQTQLEELILFDPELYEMAIDTCVENFSGAILKVLSTPTPSFARVSAHGLPYRPAFRMRYA